MRALKKTIKNLESIKKPYLYIFFFIMVSSISLTGLNGSLQNVDEVLYARVSRETLEHNSWLVQYKDGNEWFHKSPMLFWSVMLSYKLFGVSDFSTKLPSAIAAIISAFMILFISKKVFNSTKSGIISASIYLTSLQVYASTHQVAIDSLLVMNLLLTLYFTIKGIRDKSSWLFLAAFLNGLVFLTKSVLGLVIPATLFIYIIIERRWDIFYYLIIVLVISIGISFPYFFSIYKRIPDIFTESFIFKNVINRFYSKGGINAGDLSYRLGYGIVYYTVVLLLFSLPFTPGIFYIFYRKGEKDSIKDILWNDSSRILSIYFLVVLVGYSLMKGKWPHWSMPMIPVFTIFLGHTIATVKNRRMYLYFALLSSMALILFLIAYSFEGNKYPTYRDVVIGLTLVYSLFIIICFFCYFRRTATKTGIPLIVVSFFIAFTLHTAVTVPLDFNSDIKNFADVVYDEPSPLIVIGSKKVNEGQKKTVTKWYLKMSSTHYKSLDQFIKIANQVSRGTYLIYNNEYTDSLSDLYDSFKVLKTGVIWNIGIIE